MIMAKQKKWVNVDTKCMKILQKTWGARQTPQNAPHYGMHLRQFSINSKITKTTFRPVSKSKSIKLITFSQHECYVTYWNTGTNLGNPYKVDLTLTHLFFALARNVTQLVAQAHEM